MDYVGEFLLYLAMFNLGNSRDWGGACGQWGLGVFNLFPSPPPKIVL